MKRDKKSQELFASTTKDIAKTFQKAFNRGFWSGIIIGLAFVGVAYTVLMFLK